LDDVEVGVDDDCAGREIAQENAVNLLLEAEGFGAGAGAWRFGAGRRLPEPGLGKADGHLQILADGHVFLGVDLVLLIRKQEMFGVGADGFGAAQD
jgi:hypothetical protein